MEGPFFFLPVRPSPADRGWLRRGQWRPGMVTARVSVVQECSWARGRECEAEAYGPEVRRWGGGKGRNQQGEGRGPGSELVGVHPLVSALILEAHSLHQLICFRWTSAERDGQRGDMSVLPAPPQAPGPLPLPPPCLRLTCRKRRGWAVASRARSGAAAA